MLVLMRKVGETIMIGNEVAVTVLGVKGHTVRVGINAPRDIAIDRAEIHKRKQAQGTAGTVTNERALSDNVVADGVAA